MLFFSKAHAFFDGNKRTAGISATVFMAFNGFELKYPYDLEKNNNKYAEIIEAVSCNKITKSQLITWFDHHKLRQK